LRPRFPRSLDARDWRRSRVGLPVARCQCVWASFRAGPYAIELGLGTGMGRVPPLTIICAAVILVAQGVAACVSPTAPVTASEIRIGREQFGTVVNVRVADIIIVPRPLAVDEWRVDYTSSLLELLNPEAEAHPGPDGWRFRALAPGDAEVGLTPVTAGDAPPPRFALSLHVSQ